LAEYKAFQRNAFQTNAFAASGIINAEGTMAGAGTITLAPTVCVSLTLAGSGAITLAPSVFVSLTLDGVGTATLAATVYGKHVYWQKSSRFTIVSPNKITVRTRPEEGGDSFSGSATEPVSYAKLPKEDFIYASVASDAEAANIAAAKIDRLSRNSQTGSGLVPMNVGQEVLDWVLITDKWGNDAARGRVKSITRHAAANTFTMGLSFSSKTPEVPFDQLSLMRFITEGSPTPVPEWARVMAEIMDANFNDVADKLNEIVRAINSIGGRPNSVNDMTVSRAIDGTVYQNNSGGRLRLVAVNVQCAVSGTTGTSFVTAHCASSTPPATQVQIVGTTTGVTGDGVSITDSKDYVIVFAAPRGYYYKLTSSSTGDGVAPSLLDWFEFDQI